MNKYNNLRNEWINSCNQLNESSINGQQMVGLEIPIEAMHQNYGFRCQQNQSLNGVNGLNHSSNSALNSCHLRKTYSPELDSNQNPIYYESNRILYEAHQQRILRSAVSARDYIFNKKH